MARDDERRARASDPPVMGGLPNVPGIGVAMALTPGLGAHMRGLANELLVHDYPGATITRGERELLATAVSAANDCFFCMDSHGAFAAVLLGREGADDIRAIVDGVKCGASGGLGTKMRELLAIARTVRAQPLALTRADVMAAQAAGASDGDVQLAVLIASAFSMYNRMVDGFRAVTPPNAEVYAERAGQIADHGYAGPPPAGARTAPARP
jgi:uncharacterized peroxidase-related enzyme